jgi:hypothetical protein
MIHLFDLIRHWLAVHTGTYIPPGQYSDWYNFWSGFGSDLGEIVLLAAIYQVYKKHNCHVTGCARIGHHKFKDDVEGTEYLLCRKHYRQVHPDLPEKISMEHLIHIHKKNKELSTLPFPADSPAQNSTPVTTTPPNTKS